MKFKNIMAPHKNNNTNDDDNNNNNNTSYQEAIHFGTEPY